MTLLSVRSSDSVCALRRIRCEPSFLAWQYSRLQAVSAALWPRDVGRVRGGRTVHAPRHYHGRRSAVMGRGVPSRRRRRGPHSCPTHSTLHALQTALDLFRRIDEPPLLLLPSLLVRPGEAVEICGDRGSGKTALLIECAVKCVLPRAIDGKPFEGHGMSAIVVDTEGTFPSARLAAALCGRLLNAGLSEERATQEARQCMSCVHLMRCASRREFMMGLASLCGPPQSPGDARRRAAHESATALLLDSVSAYQWIERAEQRPSLARLREARSAGAAPSGDPPPYQASASFDAQLTSLLRWLRTERRMLIVWTRTPGTLHAAGFEFPIAQASPLWSGLTTYRMRLRKERSARIDGPGYQVLLEVDPAAPKLMGGGTPTLRFDVWLQPNQAGVVQLRPVRSSVR